MRQAITKASKRKKTQPALGVMMEKASCKIKAIQRIGTWVKIILSDICQILGKLKERYPVPDGIARVQGGISSD